MKIRLIILLILLSPHMFYGFGNPDSLRNVIKSKNGYAKAKALLELSDIYFLLPYSDGSNNKKALRILDSLNKDDPKIKLLKAKAYLTIGEWDKAEKILNDLRKLINKNFQKELYIQNLMLFGDLYKNIAEHTSGAIKYGPNPSLHAKMNIDSLMQSNWYAIRYRYFQKAIISYLKVLEIARAEKSPITKEQKGEIFLELSNIYSGINYYERTIAYFDSTLMLYEEKPNCAEYTYTLNRLGDYYYHSLHDYSRANLTYKKAFKFRLKGLSDSLRIASGQTDLDEVRELLYYTGSVGFSHYSLDQFNQALKYYRLALSLSVALDNKNQIANCHNYVGRALYELNRFDEATQEYKKSIYISRENGFIDVEAQTYYNLGLLYNARSLYDSALYYHYKSLKIREKIKRNISVYTSCDKLGKIYYQTTEFDSSLYFYQKALQIARMMRTDIFVKEACSNLVRLFKTIGDYKNAFEYQKLYQVFSDSILIKEQSRDIAIMQAELDFRFRERELKRMQEEKMKSQRQTYIAISLSIFIIALVISFAMTLRNQKIKEKVKRDFLLSEQKALRSQMNPHFIFNSLTSIQNLVLRKETRKANLYLADFAALMRGSLNHSMKNFIPLRDELESIKKYVEIEQLRFPKVFTFSLDIQESIDQDTTLVPPLLIQPIIENAIIHGLNHSEVIDGKLFLQVQKASDKLMKVSIEDNGIGRDRASRINSEDKNHKPTAIKNIQERLELYGKLYRTEMRMEVIDLFSELKPSGTRVILYLTYLKGY